MSIPRLVLLPVLLLVCLLSACDQIAVLDGTKAREADGFAVGSACRQAGRAIEDCFTMNPDSPKASIFAGWKEMNDYMTQNKLDTVAPQVAKADVKPTAREEAKDGAKEDAKEAGKDASRDATKEIAKDAARESAKDALREPVKPAAAAPAPSQGATLVMPAAPAASAAATAAPTGPIVAPGLPTVVTPIPQRH